MASKYKNDIEYIKQYIINQYKLLKRDDYKHNHQILYNLIKVKVNWQLFEIRQSLYLDVKQFIESYLISVDYQDYGYDNICFTKIMEVVDFLEIKQRISIMYYTKRLFYIRGYDIEFIVDKINDFKIKVAWSEKSYLEYILLLIGSSFISLLITLLIFVVIISLIMTPAPFENMEIFKVELRKFSTSPLLNQLINSLTLLTGNENISPTIIPIGIKGIVVYYLGLISFYILIVNYVLKKIEKYITLIS